jgi:lysophospholipid acyltransferase (LPLAT)-like uncharacterized protein
MSDEDAARARRRARRVAWSVRAGVWFIRLLASTWRVRQVGAPTWRALQGAARPYVLSVWHGDLLAAVWAHRGQGIAMLVSEHSDGEIIAQIGARLGQRAVRGSTSRGAARALLGLVRELRSGAVVAVTPDGPRGPRRVAQQGVVAAAQKAPAPIIAIGIAYSGAWTLSSWDAFRVPYPFARVVLSYSEPWAPVESVDDALAEVARVMSHTTAAAEAALRGA